MTAASVSAPDPRELLGHRLLIVSGKGGTGKSTVAAAIAAAIARAGRRVLLVDVDSKGSSTSALGGAPGPVGFEPVAIAPGLWAMSMDTEAALREYLRLYAPVPFIGAIGPVAGVIDFVADAAPGVREILMIGKICWEVRNGTYDTVVVDAEASGHIVSQIAAPRVLGSLVTVGMIRDQTGWMSDILEAPETTAVVIVTTAEELPVAESIEVVRRIRAETASTVGAVVVNRMPPLLVAPDDRPLLDSLAANRGAADAVSVLAWADARRREAEHLCRELADACDPAVIVTLPDVETPTAEVLGRALTAEIGTEW